MEKGLAFKLIAYGERNTAGSEEPSCICSLPAGVDPAAPQGL